MRVRARTVVLGLVGVVVVLLLTAITAVGWEVVLGPKRRPVTNRTFAVTEARLARGKYLVEGPTHCFHCHTDHDTSTPDYLTRPEVRGAGWLMPIPDLGTIAARNITPDRETGIGAWTDDEIARAIQEGVSRDGSALFPLMPYPLFAQLDEEDLASIVVFIRSIPAVRNTVPARKLVFPLNHLVNTMPVPVPGPRPTRPSVTAADRGAYLVTIGQCGGCHTAADDRGQPLPGLDFGGGGLFHDIGRNMEPFVSINITPDPSGIAHYDQARFIETLRTGRIGGRRLNPVMPVEFFRNMTDEDLGDIWAHLRTLKPVKHRVSNTDPPTACPLCKQRHGLGDLNVAN